MRKFHILSSVALAFSLFFTLGSAATQAQNGSEFAGGNGTEANPWQIATKKQLAAFSGNYAGEAGKGKYFILTKDIEFTAEDFSAFGDFFNDGSWKPLCEDGGFQGTFDGGSHEISFNGVKSLSGYNIGFFASLGGATVKNLTISYGKITITTDNYGAFGGIAVNANLSIIDNCHVKGNISNAGNFGGIVFEYGNSYVIDSSFTGSIETVAGSYCAGIAAFLEYWNFSGGTITVSGCFVDADIFSKSHYTGGIIGGGGGSIQNCHVRGDMETYGQCLGGLVGNNEHGNGAPAVTIKNSSFEGILKCSTSQDQDGSYVGGLVGAMYAYYSDKLLISESYSKGEIRVDNGIGRGDPISAGGLVGSCAAVEVADSYSHCNISITTKDPLAIGGLIGNPYGTANIFRSYAMGEIKGDQALQASISGNHAYVGGLLGFNNQQYVSILKSVAMNPSLTAPHGDKADTGRIVGATDDKCNLSNNYALDTMILKISNKDVSVTGTASDKNGLAKSASALAQKSTYTGLDWDFDEVWKMSVNGYPILAWEEDTPLPTPPTITTQPKSQTVNVGSSVTFSVTATGTDPLSYQWYKDSTAISGATSATYKISSVKASDAGSYYVVVSNDLGTVTSSAATLTVNVPVTLSSITINGSSSVNVGSTVTYTCTATYSNGTTKTVTPSWAISAGANYASITSAGVLTGKAAGTATVKATYEGKTATKNVTVNAVVVKPSITTQPKSQTVNEGNSVTFSVVATGTAPLSYQWYKDGKAISGATGSSYTISSAKSSDAGSYYVIVSNTAGSATSTTVMLTVNASVVMPKIITQPKSQTVNEGSSVTFSVVAEGSSSNADFSIPLSNSVNLDMVWIEPGTFTMGSPENELGRWNNTEYQHKVTLSQGYWIGKYEITQAQYKSVMGSNPSSGYGTGNNYPVYGVSWSDAVNFCAKLTTNEKAAGRLPAGYEYTLPTEAQWEYACRAGTSTSLNSGKNITSAWGSCSNMNEVGWYESNAGGSAQVVGQKKPNAWGLYDMHGNVWEWCLDTMVDLNRIPETYINGIVDPLCTTTSSDRVVRGGSWYNEPALNRSANRGNSIANEGRFNNGFRVVLVPVQAQGNITPLTYQWYKDGVAISGAIDSSYTIKNVKTSDAGKYTVKVCNTAGCVTSSTATLTVNVPVTLSSITINGSSSVNVGSTVTYTCTATYSNGTTKTVTPTWSISSGTSYASITSGGVLTGKAAGTATVKATYEGKTATKNVTVNAVKPTITTQPKSQTVNEGNSVTFSVVATGTAPLSYQWYKDGKAISGAAGSSYTISSAKSSDAGSYYVVVSNTAGSVTSNTVTLTVILKPVITSQPRSLTVDEDDPATFSVAATGTAPLSYQWYKDGRAISGATGSSYTISSAKKSDEGSYYVIVRNNAGSVTSNTVTLTVNKLEPDGTAIRSISINGLTATVTLTVVPNKAVNVYFVEENIPAIGTIIPNDGGVYTPAKNVIRWSFLDNASRVVSYTVTVPNYLDKVVYVNGTVTFDTNVRAITGDNELDFTLKTHPADTNENFEITTPEVSLYAVAWKLGQSWSREPADIPMGYVSRAALIWVNGGDYIYDASKSKPACWVNITARAASEEAPSVSTTKRTVSMDEGKANVSIDIVPAEGISVYLVEEQLSADVTLNVTDISDGGNYIPEKNVIRWSFLDGSPRTLTYTLEPEEGFVGTVTLNGEVMFDEETFTIEGDTEAIFRPVVHFVMEDDGKTLILNFTGTLYESEDTVTWTEVEGAESPFRVDTTKGKKFYRCVK